MNTEISAYSSGDLPKCEYLTKKDLGYKPDVVEKVKFEYSPTGKVFTDGLAKEDKSKKVGLFKQLKNNEDNLVEVDDNDNNVGIFRIIKDIKDKGIKIDNSDEAIREITKRIKELIDDEVKVYVRYNKNENKFNTEEITRSLKKLHNKLIDISEFNKEYNKFEDYKYKKEPGSFSPNQKKKIKYAKSLKDIVDFYFPKSGIDTSKKGEGLKILAKKQMFNRLPILLAQIEAGNNSNKLKNETRQILYSLYRSKALTKTVYNKLIKSIRA